MAPYRMRSLAWEIVTWQGVPHIQYLHSNRMHRNLDVFRVHNIVFSIAEERVIPNTSAPKFKVASRVLSILEILVCGNRNVMTRQRGSADCDKACRRQGTRTTSGNTQNTPLYKSRSSQSRREGKYARQYRPCFLRSLIHSRVDDFGEVRPHGYLTTLKENGSGPMQFEEDDTESSHYEKGEGRSCRSTWYRRIRQYHSISRLYHL
jgi:hypothetical protein